MYLLPFTSIDTAHSCDDNYSKDEADILTDNSVRFAINPSLRT